MNNFFHLPAVFTFELFLENTGNVPAVYIRGEEDGAVPTEMAIGMFKGLWPNGPVIRLPGVGHFLPQNAPEAVTAFIGQFIQMTRTV